MSSLEQLRQNAAKKRIADLTKENEILRSKIAQAEVARKGSVAHLEKEIALHKQALRNTQPAVVEHYEELVALRRRANEYETTLSHALEHLQLMEDVYREIEARKNRQA